VKRLRPWLPVLAYWLLMLVVSLGAHAVLLFVVLTRIPAYDAPGSRAEPVEPTYVRVDLPALPDDVHEDLPAEVDPERLADATALERPRPRDLDGQIVEVAKPDEARRPEDADYLAQYDTTVPEEMMSPRFRINPDVVAPIHSESDQEQKDASVDADQGEDAPSTAETERRDRFDPMRDGVLGDLPTLSDPKRAPWSVARTQGSASASEHSDSASLAGAPQNDRLFEDVGAGTYLNTKELLYADYLLKIRRLVNFYWSQNLSNSPSSLRIAKPEYTTVVEATLTADGALETVDVTTSSGITFLDDCVTRAYKVAGPFPNPPDALISADGRVHLPTMSWTVTFGSAGNAAAGVDPRAGVQFPGLYQGYDAGR